MKNVYEQTKLWPREVAWSRLRKEVDYEAENSVWREVRELVLDQVSQQTNPIREQVWEQSRDETGHY